MSAKWVEILMQEVGAPFLGTVLVDLIRQRNGRWPTKAEFGASVRARRQEAIQSGKDYLDEIKDR